MEPDEIIKHLEDMKRGDLTAYTKLATFYENYPNDDLSFYLRKILREFAQMFSFEPGQVHGIEPLIGLTKWLKENHGKKNKYILHRILAATTRFTELISPGEVRTCADCNAEYGYAGEGGFVELCSGMHIGTLDEIGR